MAEAPQLKLELVKTDDLIPYAGNTKDHPDWQVEEIAKSITEFGMDDPIAVWTNEDGGLEVVEGHGRLMACQKLGIEEVPVVRLDHLDDNARKAYSIIHNKTTMDTGFNLEVLNAELTSLSDFNWDGFGITPKEQYKARTEKNTSKELDLSEFAVDKYNTICPRCGMKFNT